jgi:hypothetical protein
MYVKLATERVYKKGDGGFALCYVEHERWDLTDTPNDALDSAEFEKAKPVKK